MAIGLNKVKWETKRIVGGGAGESPGV
jgi:hypothetical protein